MGKEVFLPHGHETLLAQGDGRVGGIDDGDVASDLLIEITYVVSAVFGHERGTDD